MDVVPAVVRSKQRPGALRSARSFALVVVVALGLACQSPPPPITGTLDTPESLAVAVLDALARRDEARLRALALTEAEFRTRIWPELPASRPERNLTAGYVWKDLAQKSDGYLRAVLARHGGQTMTLKRVEFSGETTDYRTFSVSRKSQLVVTDASGAEQRIRAFGSLLRADGGVKVFSYVVD